MSYEWDDKLTEKFLTLYRKHKCLWNPYSPDYKNCSVKNEAFRIVIQELDAPRIRISECLQQIEVIREKYKKEQLRAEKALQAGKVYTSKLPWFSLMSQMLCEVINDEENFSEVPVRIIPHTITKSLKRPKDGQLRKNNLEHKSKAETDANDPWNVCPTSCGWEAEKDQETPYREANQSDNHEESTGRINPGVEVPLCNNPTKILGTNNNVGEMDRVVPPPRCVDEISHFNPTTKIPASDMTQNRKKAQNPGGKLYISREPNKCNVTEDEVRRRDDGEVNNRFDDMSTKEPSAHCPRGNNEFEKNVIMCPSRRNDIHQSQCLDNQLRNVQLNQTNNCIEESGRNLVLCQDAFAQQEQKISKFEDEKYGGKEMSSQRCNKCIQQFREHSTKLNATSEDDKYKVCSGFKIIIPSSDREDQSLEITGYEVRVVNPMLSKTVLYPSSETPVGNVQCACKNEFSVPDGNANIDSARCGNIIQLNINHKCSKEPRAKKRSHRRHETDTEIDQDSGIEAEPKSFASKKTQTDCSCEDESMQTSKAVETSKFSSSWSSWEDRGCASDNSATNGSSYRSRTLDGNYNSTHQNQSTLQDDSVVSSRNTTVSEQEEDNSLPVDRFNNTRIFLNVIVRIMNSDDTNDVSESLQTTLDTMLDRIEQVPMIGQSAAEYRADNTQDANTINDTTMTTQYESLALNLAPAKRQARNLNSQKPTNKTVDLANTTTDSRPQTVQLDDRSADLRPQSLTLGEANNATNNQAGVSKRRSWPLNEADKSINARSTINDTPASLLENTNTSVNSALDYTNEFCNEEPIASSSRRFREHRTPSQLTKDFLDVIKFTMMMDGALQPTENGNKDCCRRPKE